MTNFRIFAVILLALTQVTWAARAHDFKFGYIVPLSGPDQAAGQQAVNGFWLAGRERDAHADEEADGHLGGLDVYILRIEAMQSEAAILRDVQRLIAGPGLQYLAALDPASLSPRLRKLLTASGTEIIERPSTVPRDIQTMDGEAFAAFYARRFGHAATTPAFQGYDVARTVDRLVRAAHAE